MKIEAPPIATIQRSLADAVNQTLERDWDLLALGGHEQAISHRIAICLESKFPEYHVDCEYNRRKFKGKELRPERPGAPKYIRPDIIVHRRNTTTNILAIEVKANANAKSGNDLLKLKHLKSEAAYLYKGVAFIQVRNGLEEIAEGIIETVISWYDVFDEIAERVEDRQLLQLSERIEDVKAIAQQRRREESRPRTRKS